MTDQDSTVRRRLRVEGVVQGVGFRAGCARAAERAGTGGWVRNLADGAVEAEVEGDPGAVDAVLAWCRTGPRAGRVDRVEVTELDPVGAADFTVRA
ncbi:acylphosphatase [Iamia majanohamensis]|uniref:Acylphosphatase n=1 Tax=Iamia majanohamensis TaxID=467976 RepID=A0AAF0BW75_9ACTN|nr:acylphosphatase [Iamia majanohamensis]WCO67510.1 acylphosphatase [Iamia majanohamensis]